MIRSVYTETTRAHENRNRRNDHILVCGRGNGCTFHDMSDCRTGDYRELAWVSPAGNVRLRVSMFDIPDHVLDTIRRTAREMAETYRSEFEKLPDYMQYRQILDALPATEAFDWMDDCRSLAAKLPEMRTIFYKIS